MSETEEINDLRTAAVIRGTKNNVFFGRGIKKHLPILENFLRETKGVDQLSANDVNKYLLFFVKACKKSGLGLRGFRGYKISHCFNILRKKQSGSITTGWFSVL